MCDPYSFIQQAVSDAIYHPSFSGTLPSLSEDAWNRIISGLGSRSSCHYQENDRIEFIGDGVINATIKLELYKQFPDGNPGLYTNAASALHSNATFARLAQVLSLPTVSDPVRRALTNRTFGVGSAAATASAKGKNGIKAIADLFETVIGEFYLESGFQRLSDWVRDIYKPLVPVAERAYTRFKFQTSKTKTSVISNLLSGRIKKRSKPLKTPVLPEHTPLASVKHTPLLPDLPSKLDLKQDSIIVLSKTSKDESSKKTSTSKPCSSSPPPKEQYSVQPPPYSPPPYSPLPADNHGADYYKHFTHSADPRWNHYYSCRSHDHYSYMAHGDVLERSSWTHYAKVVS